MSKYKPYPKYKESGVEWLGEVPEGWESYRIDWINTIVRGNTGFKKDELLDNGKYVALQYGKTYKVDEVNESFQFYVNEEFYKKSQVVHQGDIILISTSETVEDLGHSCFYNRNDLGLLGGEQILLKPNRKLLFDKYLYFFSKVFCDELRRYATGLKVFRFNIDDLKNIFIFIPPLQEQKAIATYLDQATEKIDALIAKQNHLIVLLKEKRQALISHVVTKGLDPDAKMKESGVEWLGEIPEGWSLPKISYIGEVTNGSTPDKNNKDYWENGIIPWLSSGCLNSYHIIEPTSLISTDAYNSCSVKLIPVGSLLVGMVGQGKTRGTTALLKIEACINQNLGAIIPSNKIFIEFLYLLFQAMYLSLRELGRGGNQSALNCDIIKTIRIPFPPKEEQKAIATYLDQKTKTIDTLIEKSTKAIELLKERRVALVSAVVTGKVDVRDFEHKKGKENEEH